MDELLTVENLKTYFRTRKGMVKAVDGVSFGLRKGEALGIAGETGSGKSVTVRSIMRIIPEPPAVISADRIALGKLDLLAMSKNQIRKIWGKEIAMVFQNPSSYINPLLKIATQMTDVIRHHEQVSHGAALEIARSVLKSVDMPDPESVLNSYPFQLSGGMIQRVMIALSLSCNPSLLIADEPTTALDVTVQAQILKLLEEVKDRTGALILITHNLAIITEVCDAVAIMYAGKLVEKGPVTSVMKHPIHPYTQGLLRAIPKLEGQDRRMQYIPGNIPNAINPPSGCRFSPRCSLATDICFQQEPAWQQQHSEHFVACHRAESAIGVI